jgi:alpha-beta hydrolase superfamily lysophospholipase
VKRVSFPSVDGIVLEGAVHESQAADRGTVVLAHGITADMDEGGMYVRLADRLAGAGLTALRFSFRGHGNSGGTDQGATIAGEMLDLQAAWAYAGGLGGGAAVGGPSAIVAASFGAVSTCLSLPWLEPAIERLVFWNPVLDLVDTFIEPTLPWGIEQFGDVARANLRRDGTSLTDGTFKLGRVLFREMSAYDPRVELQASSAPLLVIHGDRDGSVSYEVARRAAQGRPHSQLLTIEGADHGFASEANIERAIAATVDFLSADRPV